jgi:hypothetical protein
MLWMYLLCWVKYAPDNAANRLTAVMVKKRESAACAHVLDRNVADLGSTFAARLCRIDD